MGIEYKWPRPSVTVDSVLFGVDLNADGTMGLQVLLIRRKYPPFEGMWALPGGFVDVKDDGNQGESLEDAARRELWEETGIEDRLYLEQLGTFGTPGRDPRGRVISVAYMALTQSKAHLVKGADDAAEACWVRVDALYPENALAFDHTEIVSTAIARLRAKIRYAPIGFNLLPPKFSLTELQKLYEALLGRQLDKRNFRKKILAMGILVECGMQKETTHRPACLFRFNKTAYNRAVLTGFNFEI